MKAWLGAALRLVADFSAALLALALARALALTAAAPSLANLLAVLPGEARSALPLAIAAATVLGLFSFHGAVRTPLIAWSSSFFLILALTAGFLALAPLLPLESGLPAAEPREGVPVDAGSLTLSVSAYSSEGARGVFAIDYAAPYPRLQYADPAPYDPALGAVLIRGTRFPATRPSSREELAWLPPELGLAAARGDNPSTGFLEDFLGLLGLALLVTGLALPGLSAAWPLAGFAWAMLGALFALAFDLVLNLPWTSALLAAAAQNLGFGAFAGFLGGAVEFLLGLLLVAAATIRTAVRARRISR